MISASCSDFSPSEGVSNSLHVYKGMSHCRSSAACPILTDTLWVNARPHTPVPYISIHLSSSFYSSCNKKIGCIYKDKIFMFVTIRKWGIGWVGMYSCCFYLLLFFLEGGQWHRNWFSVSFIIKLSQSLIVVWYDLWAKELKAKWITNIRLSEVETK